ncbi:25537_t:CDS:2, partial [Gigaspora rosea]
SAVTNDTSEYSDFSNIQPLRNAKNINKYIKKETKCLVRVKRDGNIVECSETFALLTSTSTLGSYLRTIYRLLDKGSLLPLSGTSEQPASKKPINIAQKDPTQPTLIDTLKNKPLLSSKKKDRLTSRLLAWIVDDMQAFNVLENEKFHDFVYEAESYYQIPFVRDIRDKIELNIACRWEDPVIEGYLASILDPRFKNLEFASEKFEETKASLRQQMRMLLIKNECSNDQPTAKPFSNLASFFNNATPTKKFSPIDIELKTYFDLPQMTIYNPDDLEYKTENPLSWWQLHLNTLPLLACLAQFQRLHRS